jgi:hypothetical protein
LTTPRYAYTSVEVGFFTEKFKELERPVFNLVNQIHRYFADEDERAGQQ